MVFFNEGGRLEDGSLGVAGFGVCVWQLCGGYVHRFGKVGHRVGAKMIGIPQRGTPANLPYFFVGLHVGSRVFFLEGRDAVRLQDAAHSSILPVFLQFFNTDIN